VPVENVVEPVEKQQAACGKPVEFVGKTFANDKNCKKQKKLAIVKSCALDNPIK
jgi:hypothetical protein